MNYQTIYNSLMERSKSRVLSGYSEKHHIIPRCMGGDNSQENIAILTAEEHYVAHLLLVKIHPGNIKLLWAASAMTNGTTNQNRAGNKMYGWLRHRLSEAMSSRTVSDETRAKLSAKRKGNLHMLGKTHSDETKERMASASKGRKKSESHRAALSAAKLGKKRGPQSEEHKKRLSLSNIEAAKHKDKSFMQTPEYKEHQAEKMRQVWENRRRGLSPMPIYI